MSKSFETIVNGLWFPIKDFRQEFPRPYQLKVFNYESDNDLELAFGDPTQGARIELFVPRRSAQTFENRPCVNILFARTTNGASSTVRIEFDS